MALSKDQAPSNAEKPKAQVAKQDGPSAADKPGTVAPLQSDANPAGDTSKSTGPVGATEVIDAQEHVLGDDPRRVAHTSGYHDSLTGAPITEDGEFVEESRKGTGPVPKHRIVADNWPQEREQIDSPLKREGNDAS